MQKTVILTAFLLLATIPLAAGQTEDLEGVRQQYNERSSELPAIAGTFIGHQKVNVYVNRSDGGEETIAFEMKGRNMTEIGRETYQNQTVDVWTNQEALVSIIQADDGRAEIRRQMEQGNIDYQVYGFMNRLRLAVVRMVV